MKRMGYQPWVGLPNILLPRLRRARAAPGRRHARGAGRMRRWPGSTTPPRARALRAALHTTCTIELRRDTARAATDAIAQDPRLPEQLGPARWDAPGPGGRRRRGRPRPAGRPGGGRGGDPRRPAADQGPGRLEEADRRGARERLFDEIRAKALCCCIAEASVEEIDALNILQATLLAMRRAVEACACGRTRCWSTATGCRC